MTEQINYEELADQLDQFREGMRIMVAGLVADGFTDREARTLIVAIFTRKDDQ